MSAKARAEEWAAKQSGDTSLVAEKNQERRERAIKWVDKEIRKLISEILRIAPSRSIAYGPLFAETSNTFEALSGTLVAAKKRGVVEYDGQLLLQRVHDHVIIKLLKTEIEDTPIPKETPRPIKISSNTSGFDTVDPNAPVNCATCNKRVYPTERLAAAGKVYHSEGCFVCAHCKGILRSTEFCSVNGKVYCQPHYLELFKQKGGFSFGDDGDSSAAKKSPQIAPAKTPTKPIEPITTKPQGSPTLPARNHPAHKDKPLPTPNTNSAPTSKPTSTTSSANSSTSSSPALTPASLSPSATPPPAKKTIAALKPATTANTTECSKCKATLTATAKFCVSCGTPTIPPTSSTSSSSSPPRTCNTCHKEINATTKFCPHCGEKCDIAPVSTSSVSTPASLPAAPAPAPKSATTSTNAPALAPRPHLKESPKASPVPSPQASPKTQPKELLSSLPAPTLSSFGSSSSSTISSSSSSSSNAGKTLPTPDAALASLSLKDKEKEKEKPKDDKPASLLIKPLPIPNSSPSSSVSSGASSPSSLSPSTSTSALTVPSPSSSLEPPPSPSTTSVRRPPKMPPALKSSPSFSATDRNHSSSMGSIPPLSSTSSWPNRSLPQPGGATSPPTNKNRSVSYATTATTSVATSSIVDSVSRKHQTTARLIEYLLMNGTYETGIFKTNYNPEEEASLNKAITSGVASNINLSEYTISTIASCLKRLLRSSYPLFPSKHYDQLITMGSRRELAAKIVELTALVESLPRDHRAVLAELFMLLSAIADHSNSTMMDAKTLAYTFGPLLIVPKGLKIDIKDAVNEQRICNDLVLDMIENSDSIFEAPDDNVKWVPDEDVKKCTKCNGNFGLILRKKRCKVCGYMFCSKCSSKKVDGRRACDECYELQH